MLKFGFRPINNKGPALASGSFVEIGCYSDYKPKINLLEIELQKLCFTNHYNLMRN